MCMCRTSRHFAVAAIKRRPADANFFGYERADGSVGTRNVVAIASVMDNSNPVARAVASAVRGTVLLPGLFMRGQLGRDREITLGAMAGLCLNPTWPAWW